MKKIYLLLVALLCIGATSCSNDDIEVEAFTGGTLTLRISTQGVYDTFECTSKLQDNFLRDNTLHIGVTSYLYDSNGTLKEKKFSTAKDFNRIEQKFETIPTGTYTLLTVQMLVDPNNDNKYVFFDIDKEDNIRTLRIVQKYHGVDDIAAIGVNTQEIIIGKGDQVVDITTKAIGSRVKVYYENLLGIFPYDNVGFGTTDALEAYLLDPTISTRKNRFETYLSDKESFCLRGYLPTEEADKYINSLYLLENNIEYRFCWQNEEDGQVWYFGNANAEAANLEDGKTYCAGMYFYEDKSFNTFFGFQDDFNIWLEECKNYTPSPEPEPEPEPEAALYYTPYVNWSNGTFSQVNKHMSGYTASSETPIYDEDSEAYSIMYENSESTRLYQYLFKESTHGLTDAYVGLPVENVSENDIISQLQREGYEYHGFEKEYEMYVFSNSTTSIIAYTSNDGSMWIINYYDPNAYRSNKKKVNCTAKINTKVIKKAPKAKNNYFTLTNKIDPINANLIGKKNFNTTIDVK